MSRLETAAEKPVLVWAIAAFNWMIAVFEWTVNHASQIAGIFALFGAMFGCVAAYYSMRVNRRTFKRGETRVPFD